MGGAGEVGNGKGGAGGSTEAETAGGTRSDGGREEAKAAEHVEEGEGVGGPTTKGGGGSGAISPGLRVEQQGVVRGQQGGERLRRGGPCDWPPALTVP